MCVCSLLVPATTIPPSSLSPSRRRRRRKAPYVTLGHLCHAAAYHDVVLVTAADPHKTLFPLRQPSLFRLLWEAVGGGVDLAVAQETNFLPRRKEEKNGSRQGGGGIRKRRGMRIDAPHPRGNKVVRLSSELSTATHHNLQKKSNIAATPPHRIDSPLHGGGVCNGEKKCNFDRKRWGWGHCGGRQCMLPNSIRSGLIFSFVSPSGQKPINRRGFLCDIPVGKSLIHRRL